MRKYVGFLILVVLIIVSAVGCTSITMGKDFFSEENGQNEKNTSSETIMLEEINDINQLPKEVTKLLNQLSKNRGYTIIKSEEDTFLLFVALGEKSTGGYSLKRKELKIENESITVVIEEIEPAPGTMVTEAFTYPHKIFWLKGNLKDINQVKVINQYGESFPMINLGITQNEK